MKKTLVAWLDSQTLTDSVRAHQGVFFFHGATEYPILFFAAQIRVFQEQGNPVQHIDAASTDWASVEGILSTQFLGQSMIYNLRNVHSLEAKKYKRALSMLADYQGPHSVLVWLPADADLAGLKVTSITIPQLVDRALFSALIKAFGFKRLTQNTSFITSILQKIPKLSLDLALLICSYGMVLGADSKLFTSQWLDQLTDESPSLFTLSQHFFARDEESFGVLWQQIKDTYQAPFWIAFWSEQLFRAAGVILYHTLKNDAGKKRISFRLPFSFLSSGIKEYTFDELMRAHDAVYEYDLRFKSGCSEHMIELFYARFFERSFR